MRRHYYLVVIGLLLVVAGMAFLSQPVALAQDSNPEDLKPVLPAEPEFLQPIYQAWASSGHADVDAMAFNDWNADGAVPARCAKCHSTPGYSDFLGADGSAVGTVEVDAPIGTVITCDACHSAEATALTSVVFPSGAEITGLDDSARCMQCHQGRASGVSVTQSLTDNGALADMNVVNAELSFINIHYYAAAATLYGSEAQSGYQFEGKTYQPRNNHVDGFDSCISCHNPHTLEINLEACASCHEAESVEELREIRMQGSRIDYDGDGSSREGIAEEISTLQEMTMTAIQAYASEVVGTPLVYNSAAYPYWFIDANADGQADDGDTERYATFSGNLLVAAYNYQVSAKDPGAFAHNPKYIIALLYDTIEMLNEQITTPVDLSQAHRNDPGHFDATAQAFRNWDEDGAVDATCSKCHTSTGLPFFMEHGVLIEQPVSNGLECSTCHSDFEEFTLHPVNEVVFPSGASLSFEEGDPNNVCLNCHQGRESTVSVNAAIAGAGVGDDEVSDKLRFRNPHYFAAGATLYGSEAQGAYQYEGQEYNGRNEHTRSFDTCADCHNPHSLEVEIDECIECHENLEDEPVLWNIREEDDADPVDYNGNGDVEEGVAFEIASLEEALLAQIKTYASETIGTALAYSSSSYPYWFIDANANGEVDAEETERYAQWTPTLLRAAYNYQYVAKDPGGFAHNPDYLLQVLYDSLAAIGADVSSYNRPPVRVADSD